MSLQGSTWGKDHLRSTCAYLEDESVRVGPSLFFGSPWTPRFGDRFVAFTEPLGSRALKRKWEAIPAGTDVLVVHGPPLGRRDLCWRGARTGCGELLARVHQVRPRVVVMGHIHEARGFSFDGHTLFVNVASSSGGRITTTPLLLTSQRTKGGRRL